MIGVATEETNGSDRGPGLKRLRCEPLVGTALLRQSEMALYSECMSQCARKTLDTADIVRDACFRQLAVEVPSPGQIGLCGFVVRG